MAWSPPIKIYAVEEQALYEPVVTADRGGAVHVLWRGLQNALYYARLDQSGWSQPVDVLTGANVASAVVDERGVLHVIWAGANFNLVYAMARASEAHSAHAWSSPQAIEMAFQRPQIAVDTEGGLHIAFATAGVDAVKYMVSRDGGATWTSSVVVAQSSRPEAGVGDTRLAVGPDGAIHVVWTEYLLPNGWPPLGVFYSRSTDGGLTWTLPGAMAGDGYDQITVLAANASEIHVAWNGMAGVGGRYHRWSGDRGETWSGVNIISNRGGTEGFPSLVVDSAGAVHLLTTFDHCAQYSRWNGDSWSRPMCISGPEAMASNYIEEAAMALSEGNRLHAVFWDGRQRLWYTSRQVEAPAIAPAPFPTSAPTATLMPRPVSEPTVTPTKTPPPAMGVSAPKPRRSALQMVLIGVVPAALLTAGVVIAWRLLRPRRYRW